MKYYGPHINTNFINLIYLPFIAYKLKATIFSFGLSNFYKKNYLLNKNIEFFNIFKNNINKYNFNINYIIPHSSFYINLGQNEKYKLFQSKNRLLKEIKFLKNLNIKYINCHIGYHLNKINKNKCLDIIIQSINYILDKINNFTIIIENSSGQGTALGYDLNHLINIIQNINKKFNIGICLDICHLFSAGYKIDNLTHWNNILDIINNKIGLNYLKLIHLNDSKYLFNSKKDKHENLFKGNINKNFFIFFKKNNKIFKNIPIILETPNSKYLKSEINWLKNI